jgi:hypothetical protein
MSVPALSPAPPVTDRTPDVSPDLARDLALAEGAVLNTVLGRGFCDEMSLLPPRLHGGHLRTTGHPA